MATKGKHVDTLTLNNHNGTEQGAQTFPDRLRQIAHDLRRICEDSELQEYDELVAHAEKMKKKVHDQQNDIMRLRHTLDVMGQKYNDLFEQFKQQGADNSKKNMEQAEENQKLVGEKTQLENNRISQDKRLRAQDAELQDNRRRLAHLEKSSQKDKKDLSILKEQLEGCRKTLETLQDNVGILPINGSNRDEMKNFKDGL